MNNDKLIIGGHEFNSRFILGSGKYSMKLIEAAVKDAGAEIITLAVRRANTKEQESILDYIPQGITLLPNTSGARNAEEAVRIARLARELGCGNFVKIEIMRDSKYLLPDNVETIKATELLAKDGFVVMPYMYPDLNVALDLGIQPVVNVNRAGSVSVDPNGPAVIGKFPLLFRHLRHAPPLLLQVFEIAINTVGDSQRQQLLIIIGCHISIFRFIGHKAHFHDGHRNLTPVDSTHGICFPNV